jgi:hypothetical protein
MGWQRHYAVAQLEWVKGHHSTAIAEFNKIKDKEGVIRDLALLKLGAVKTR